MSSTVSKFASAMMSAAALGALAVVPLGISIYIFAVMAQGRIISGSMILLGGILGFIGVGLAIGCIYTVWWAFTKSAQKEKSEADDESWRDMPYPKS
jgi:hypothetical protein